MIREVTIRQEKAINKATRKSGLAVWWRVGQGKTRIALKTFATVANQCWMHGRILNPLFLVVCRRAAFDDWKVEERKLNLGWAVQVIDSDAVPLERSKNCPKLLLISHGMLSNLRDFILKESDWIEGICYDEGFLYKNPRSEHCQIANELSKKSLARCCLLLSGSIMTARDLTDVFGQLYAINKHQVLARTLTEFRSRFMYQFKIGTFYKQANQKGAVARVAKLIKPISSVYFPSFSKQREVKNITKIFEPTRFQLKLVQDLKRDYAISLEGKELEVRNAPSLIIKAQQISNGWLRMPKGHYCEFATLKLDALKALLEELMDAEERVVVWCAFQHDIKYIQSRIPFATVAMSGKQRLDLEKWNSRKVNICLATEASGSSINAFGQCAYAIYYSMDFKWLSLQQSKGRTNRTDSKHATAFYYFFQVQQTLDSFVYRTAHNSGQKELDLLRLRSWLGNQAS